ncbi:MAG: endopeptidase La [Actinobacteria bacterium]|nr:endopeptidase La [Actinomycetota bacterium]
MPDTQTQILPLLPLKEGVILPHMVVTISVDSESSDESFEAIAAARQGDGYVLLVPRIDDKYASIGTVAKLEDSQKAGLPDTEDVLIVRGLHRAVVGTGVPGEGKATWVQAEPVQDPSTYDEHVHQLAKEYRAVVENILEMRGERGVARFLRGIHNPGHMADTAGYAPYLSFEQKLEILESVDVAERLEKLLEWSRETLADFSLKDKIRSDVAEGMEKTQRDFLLRQQMDAIRKELGEEGDDVVAEYRARFDKIEMPDDVRKEVNKELDRLERTSAQNPEQGYIRNYLDWMVELPWDKRSDDEYDVAQAREVLDADHTGLEDVKDRIIEFLAVKKLRDERGLGTEVGGRGMGAIITLVGPPGVGKTSLGESVARAMGRKFARVSLGGIHDEAEIRGHRRTYVGAMPGRLVRALKEAGTKNPVIMLDEIDKVGADWRGDPSSALLEVLDPAQNHSFRDHYLDVDLDLSDVLFIPTANVSETIPAPLLDRMEIVRLDGYTEQEKLDIARNHLMQRQVERNGLSEGEVEITDEALRKIIGDYTREAGVRNLEREIGKVLRKAATSIASGKAEPPLKVDRDQVKEYLGKVKYFFEGAERTGQPGVATGLAVTGHGGDVLFIEATEMAGKEGLTLTGQLGDVMKESAQIALSYVRSHADKLAIAGGFDNRAFHLHVPAGAVPKDGPSAGTAMTTALVSLLTSRPVKGTVAMTGEVTLQGNVLPIGGVKQKVLAAHRAGFTDVILPYRNEADLEDVPDSVLAEIKVHLAKRMVDVIDIALEPAEREKAA